MKVLLGGLIFVVARTIPQGPPGGEQQVIAIDNLGIHLAFQHGSWFGEPEDSTIQG